MIEPIDPKIPFSQLSARNKLKGIVGVSVVVTSVAALLGLLVLFLWTNFGPCECSGSRSEDPECCYVH